MCWRPVRDDAEGGPHPAPASPCQQHPPNPRRRTGVGVPVHAALSSGFTSGRVWAAFKLQRQALLREPSSGGFQCVPRRRPGWGPSCLPRRSHDAESLCRPGGEGLLTAPFTGPASEARTLTPPGRQMRRQSGAELAVPGGVGGGGAGAGWDPWHPLSLLRPGLGTGEFLARRRAGRGCPPAGQLPQAEGSDRPGTSPFGGQGLSATKQQPHSGNSILLPSSKLQGSSSVHCAPLCSTREA